LAFQLSRCPLVHGRLPAVSRSVAGVYNLSLSNIFLRCQNLVLLRLRGTERLFTNRCGLSHSQSELVRRHRAYTCAPLASSAAVGRQHSLKRHEHPTSALPTCYPGHSTLGTTRVTRTYIRVSAQLVHCVSQPTLRLSSLFHFSIHDESTPCIEKLRSLSPPALVNCRVVPPGSVWHSAATESTKNTPQLWCNIVIEQSCGYLVSLRPWKSFISRHAHDFPRIRYNVAADHDSSSQLIRQRARVCPLDYPCGAKPSAYRV
jgi:hypothetical protein